MRRIQVLSVVIIVLSCILYLFFTVNKEPVHIQQNVDYVGFDHKIDDISYEWIFDESEDLQLPELPTGCEATAASILSRMQGAFVTKTAVADALPRSNTDFVNAFIGNPYFYSGWSCSAKAITNTLNSIFSSREEFAAIELTGDDLDDLVLPAAVWISIGMTDPGSPALSSDGYLLYYDTHCVVVTDVTEDYVYTVDPLRGEIVYTREIFEPIYDKMGKEAVHVGKLDDVLKLMRERDGR